MRKVTKMLMTLGAATMVATGAVGVAHAQRDPAYEAAREAGQVGEKVDGYLGIVGSATPALQSMVNDINIRRKAAYTKRAANSASVEQFAFVSGCNLIARTAPGEKYQAPDGSWQTRGNGPPQRDPRCV